MKKFPYLYNIIKNIKDMKDLEFTTNTFDRDTFRKCIAIFKGVEMFEIVFEKGWREEFDRFGIRLANGSTPLIGFQHIDVNPEDDLDFIEPHRFAKTFEGAKKNCEKIIQDFIMWIVA